MVEFEELYLKYYKDIYYFILKLTGYRDDLAEELTQESFYQAFVSLGRFRGECEIKSWLCQIAKNTYYKHLRTHAKQLNIGDELFPEPEEKNKCQVVLCNSNSFVKCKKACNGVIACLFFFFSLNKITVCGILEEV
ncbi:MAG: RNA polymerase sigma factor [Lachnospiraceae bacterium]|nr:RNA polymerase sigma factor [Lachnospiraceae bacterium]